MEEREGRLQIDLLGTSFAIQADQPSEYLQAIYNHYKKVVAEVQETAELNEPLKVAIIAGILLSDALSRERLNPQSTSPQYETEALIEQSTKRMIEGIDSIIYSIAPPDDERK